MHHEILYQCDPILNIHCEHHQSCMAGFHDSCYDTLDQTVAKRTRNGTPIVDFIYIADDEGHKAPLIPSGLTPEEKRMPKTPNYRAWLRTAEHIEQFGNEEVRWDEPSERPKLDRDRDTKPIDFDISAYIEECKNKEKE